MITGFEDYTERVTDREKYGVIPRIVGILQKHAVEKTNVMTGSRIMQLADMPASHGPRLRKFISYIRIHGLIPRLLSNQDGYWISSSREEIEECIQSQRDRITAQQAIVDSLTRDLSQLPERDLFTRSA